MHVPCHRLLEPGRVAKKSQNVDSRSRETASLDLSLDPAGPVDDLMVGGPLMLPCPGEQFTDLDEIL